MAVNITLTEPQQGNPVLDRGPLKELYRAPNTGIDNLQYPRDLGSSQKNHYVTFKIFDTKTFGETLAKGAGAVVELGSGLIEKGSTALNNVMTAGNSSGTQSTSGGLAGKTTTTATSVPAGSDANNFMRENGTLNLGSQTQDVSSGSVTLYMPDGLEFQTQAQYGELSIMQALLSIVPTGSGGDKGKTSTFDKSAFLGGAGKLGLNYAGYVFNPQQQLLFEGINFRRFSMSFTFTPYSSKEASTVKDIVTKFRSAAAPEIVKGVLGFLFIPPSQFDISFMSNGVPNPYINKVKRCYLENVDVNYAPNGWVAHSNDGAPVQTTMSLSFIETELIDRTQIALGF